MLLFMQRAQRNVCLLRVPSGLWKTFSFSCEFVPNWVPCQVRRRSTSQVHEFICTIFYMYRTPFRERIKPALTFEQSGLKIPSQGASPPRTLLQAGPTCSSQYWEAGHSMVQNAYWVEVVTEFYVKTTKKNNLVVLANLRSSCGFLCNELLN